MHHLEDLHLSQEIIPLFDYVSNEFSRDSLINLFSHMPASVEEINVRQQILKALLAHPHLFKPIPYSPVELLEVYEAMMHNKDRQTFLENRSLLSSLPFASIERQQQQGKTILILSFFQRIYAGYFSKLDVQLFPDSFKHALVSAKNVLADLEVEQFSLPSRKNRFGTKQFLEKMRRLEDQVRSGKMMKWWSALFLFEAYVSIARGMRRFKLTFPEFGEDRLIVQDVFHPLLKNPVKNTIEVKAGVTILTGPNMSGKSTLLKSLGWCVYLAHLGIGVPARRCVMKFYDVIFVSIDLKDNINSGYSHFQTEISLLKKVVSAAFENKRCFAVFDELFRGTNNEDALAISTLTIQGLTKFRRSCFFISTHLHEIRKKIVGNREIATMHISCDLVDERPVFTYKVKEGWSDVKIGQLLFEKEGLSQLLK
jgi:DNA mismatch repair protein MutS